MKRTIVILLLFFVLSQLAGAGIPTPLKNESLSGLVRWNFDNLEYYRLRMYTGKADIKVKTTAVVDGITAPTTVEGYAIIYVDTADGDLKVIFGDGTITTIATD